MKNQKDATLDFAFHFPLKLEYLSCAHGSRVSACLPHVPYLMGVWYVLDGHFQCAMWALLCIGRMFLMRL